MAELCPSGGRIRAPLWGPESSSVQRMEFIGNDGSSVLTAERERTSSGKGVQHDDELPVTKRWQVGQEYSGIEPCPMREFDCMTSRSLA